MSRATMGWCAGWPSVREVGLGCVLALVILVPNGSAEPAGGQVGEQVGEEGGLSGARPNARPNVAPAVPREVPRKATAREQLEHAQGLRTALRGSEGPERERARLAAVEAFRAVRELFPTDAQACAEAAFRAGELLRSGGDAEGAQVEFRLARERAGETAWRIRALLELGHLDRRARRPQAALTSYEAVLASDVATRAQKDDASLWVGVVQTALERHDDARRAWLRVAEAGEDPLDRVRGFDHLALASISRADLEGAAGWLERCRESLADVAAEETRIGERVRSAMADMRAHDALARAIAEREKMRGGQMGSVK